MARSLVHYGALAFAVLAPLTLAPVVSGARAADQSTAATHDLDAILRGLATRFSDIRELAMHVEAAEEIVNGIKPPPLQNDQAEVSLGDKKLGYERISADYRIDGSRRYKAYRFPPLGTYGAPLSEGEQITWDGAIAMRLEPGGTGYILAIQEKHSTENLAFRHLYWPVHEFSLNEKDHLYLPRSIEGQAPFVHPTLEKIDEHLCHVVEAPGKDKLWVDCSKNFALIQREVRFGPNQPLRVRTVATGWQKVGANLWLPQHITRDYFCPLDRPADKWNTVATRVTIEATYKSQPFKPEDFRIAFPQRTLVTDLVRSQVYRAGIDDPLDAAIDAAQRLHPQRRVLARSTSATLYFCVAMALTATFLYGLRRWMR
ncbi:MAG: hypothetical protein HYS13_16925 [Planctomycetia bacterium]|nr:hypothetical protein [Planctomycetia bacterium]